MYNGCDISDYQYPIDWKQLVMDFVFIKATEGIHTKNIHLESQSSGAFGKGILFGYYHFAHTKNSPQDELNHFISIVKLLPTPTIGLVLDIEANDGNLNSQDLLNWIEIFLEGIVKLGYKAILYSYGPFLKQLPSNNLSIYPLWLADYENSAHIPSPWINYTIWQYTGTGKVTGINGDVDLNKAISLTFDN